MYSRRAIPDFSKERLLLSEIHLSKIFSLIDDKEAHNEAPVLISISRVCSPTLNCTLYGKGGLLSKENKEYAPSPCSLPGVFSSPSECQVDWGVSDFLSVLGGVSLFFFLAWHTRETSGPTCYSYNISHP